MGAVDREGAERRDYILAECGEDAALLGSVRRLLAALDQTGTFLETPALHSAELGTSPPEPVERVIGGYRTVRVIGVGGMATVYEAMQEQPRRRVALKVMRRALPGSSAVRRFEFETEVLAKLQHPGIAQIYEAGAADEEHGLAAPFFAMEYIADAETITAYAETRGLPAHERLAMLAEVCDAVHHGHQHGVIHRDLKPGNILVDSAGRPRVIDFGVARSTDPGHAWITQQTSVGQIVGTLNYMSPEQCRADADVDTRADVYSLGVVLYQLTAGRLPHDLSSAPLPAALRIITEESPPRPSAFNPACHRDVDAIVMKAMDKDPARRYPSAAALGSDIRRYLRHQTIEARPPTVLRQCRLFARRNRALVSVALAAVLLITAAALVSALSAVRATRESARREAAEKRALAQRDAALWQKYIADIAAGFGALQSGETQLVKTRLGAAPEKHRGWEWRLLDALADGSLRTLHTHQDMIYSFAVSPDGARVATGSRDGALRVWDRVTGEEHLRLDGFEEAAPHALAFTHDGGRLVRGNFDGSVEIVDLSTGEARLLLGADSHRILAVACSPEGLIAAASSAGHAHLWCDDGAEISRAFDDQPGGVHGVAFSPDGCTLATWNRRGLVRLRDASGEPTGDEFTFGSGIQQLTFSADGRLIAGAGAGGRIVLWDASGLAEPRTLQTPWSVSTIVALAFSPSGQTIAVGQVDRAITLLSLDTGEQRTRLRGHEEAVSGLWISPEGTRLLSASWDRTVREWDVAPDAPPDFVATLRGHTDQVLDVDFSPDGSLLASASSDRTVRLWDPVLVEAVGMLPRHAGTVYSVAFSPDGRLLATGDSRGAVRLWEAATGARAGGHDGHPGAVWTVEFGPDGRMLASGGDFASIRVWEIGTDAPVRAFEGHEARAISLAFSPDGARLASASRDGTVKVWDVATGSELRTLGPHRSDVFAVLYSADGSRLYSGSRDQTVRFWNTGTPSSEGVLDGHGQFITGLSLNPDGSRLAAGSWFGEIILWDTATLDAVASFKGHEEAIRAIEFDPSSRWLASAGHDQTIRLWDTWPREERIASRAAALRDREHAERIVADLFGRHTDAGHALGGLAGLDAEPGVLHQARKLVLARALAGNR